MDTFTALESFNAIVRLLTVDYCEVFKNLVDSTYYTIVADVVSLTSKCLSGLNDSLNKVQFPEDSLLQSYNGKEMLLKQLTKEKENRAIDLNNLLQKRK